MRTAGALALAALLAACNAQAPGGAGGGTGGGGADIMDRLNLPPGVSRADVYTRTPDPRAGPCYYYRVEGLEVLAECAG